MGDDWRPKLNVLSSTKHKSYPSDYRSIGRSVGSSPYCLCNLCITIGSVDSRDYLYLWGSLTNQLTICQGMNLFLLRQSKCQFDGIMRVLQLVIAILLSQVRHHLYLTTNMHLLTYHLQHTTNSVAMHRQRIPIIICLHLRKALFSSTTQHAIR